MSIDPRSDCPRVSSSDTRFAKCRLLAPLSVAASADEKAAAAATVMALRKVQRWRAQLAHDGFCVVDVCTPKEAAEWKAVVQQLEQERISNSSHSQTVVDPSTKSVVDPSETGITVWMTEPPSDDAASTSSFPDFFLRKLARRSLLLSCQAFYPCPHHQASKHQHSQQQASRTPHRPHIELLSCKPVRKTNQVTHASPWHQDWVYWYGAPKVSAWVALDDARKDNGCLRVIPGSHLWGLVPHEQFQERIGFDRRIPDNDVDALARKFNAKPVDVPIRAGQAIIFSDLLLHSSNANATGADRYALIPTFRDATVPDSSKVWRSGAPFDPRTTTFVPAGVAQGANSVRSTDRASL